MAKSYLASRGITDEIIKEFEIGLSLDSRDDLTKLLIKKEYDLVTLNRIGLSSDDHDIYNDRIMFPLYDVSGKVVGFSGRIYKDNGQNKYLNTKETDIFKKGEMLYHYHVAREECRLKKQVIVMEGFMDVIRASTIGIKNTVALMGTALTKEQIALLKRLSNNIIKLDMSEYSEPHTISKLIGSPAGYVGYNDNKNIFDKVKDKNVITVYNKNDLNKLSIIEDNGVCISCKTGENLDLLKKMLYEIGAKNINTDGEFITQKRHYFALNSAIECLNTAINSIGIMPLDLVCNDIKECWDKLGEITGTTASEDIINEIFARFCVGK